MCFTVSEEKIYVRVYKLVVGALHYQTSLNVLICRIMLKKSGSQLPRVELEEMGPSLDLVMRRTQLASDDLMRQACKKPKAVKVTGKED